MSDPRNVRLSDLLTPGCRVAVADGFGMPTQVFGELSAAARAVGNVRLVLGWCPAALEDFDPEAFADVRSFMAGYGLRRLVDQGSVHYIPARLQTVLKLLRGSLRPDVLVASVGRGPNGWNFTTEVAWMRAAVETGAIVAAVERPNHPVCDAGPPIPESQLRFIGSDPSAPILSVWAEPGDIHRAIGSHIAPFIEAGSRLQFGPGPLGVGVLDALKVPVRIDTGLINDAVPLLESRGQLLDTPIAPYMAGSEELFAWAKTKVPMLHGLEVTHSQARLGSGAPLVTINTALEIDIDGQVNVEAVGGSAIAGIGGQPDFAFAGASALSGGVSIVAVTSRNGKNATLVERLSAPVSTPSHDIDVIVTEKGAADLRGLDRRERRVAIARLWD